MTIGTAGHPEPDVAAAVIEAITQAAQELEANADEHAASIARLIQDEVQEDLGMGRSVPEATLAAVRGHVIGFARATRDEPSPDAIHASSAAIAGARAYVRRRYPLSALLHAYRIGHQELARVWRDTLTAVERDPQICLRALDHSAPMMFAYIDAVTSQAVLAFEEEVADWSRSMDAIRADTVVAVLEQRDDDMSIAHAETVLRYRFEVWHLGLVVWLPETEGLPTEDFASFASQAVPQETATARIVVPVNRRLAWVWFGGRQDAVEQCASRLAAATLPPPARALAVSMGEPAFGLDGFRATHEQALHARRLGELSGHPRGVSRYGPLALLAMATAEPSLARWFVERELGPLAGQDDHSLRLRATLAAYLEDGASQKSAAKRLGIHVNTVVYRLRQCEQLLGHAPSDRALELGLALRLAPFVGV